MEKWVQSLLSSRKYRALGIPEATIQDLITKEGGRGRSSKELEQVVREKLHNIVAGYLGDPDYAAAQAKLETAFGTGDRTSVEAECLDLLAAHASTRERLAVLDEFYQRLFAITGVPRVVVDLACGLHPFGLPWMNLPLGVEYYAYDLNQPRVALIQRFLGLSGLPELAFHQDILVNPPQVRADVAFFFKEAHRFEQRQRGCNRAFWQALPVHWLLVSLPSSSLTGRRDLAERQRALVARTLEGLEWTVIEIQMLDEIVFCIDKHREQV
jgi:16S rRNA (guanine(1405)-N(7))-methyltransferase